MQERYSLPVVQNVVTYNQGIYAPAEVAFLAKLHPTTLNRWFFGNQMGERVIPKDNGEEKTLNFLDFIQALAVRTMRTEYKVPLPKIREAIVRAEQEYGQTHIFARPHKTVLFGKDILISLDGLPGPLQLTGKNPNQITIKPVVEMYLRDLGYDDTGLANLFTAFKYANQRVLIDPAVRFGEPYIPDCGYSAQTLRDAVISEGGVREAAKAFDVHEDAVEVAYRYYESLKTAA